MGIKVTSKVKCFFFLKACKTLLGEDIFLGIHIKSPESSQKRS